METNKKERIICCALAFILFFLGICMEPTSTDSSFFCALKETRGVEARVHQNDYIIETSDTCITSVLGSRTMICRSSTDQTSLRKQTRNVLVSSLVATMLQDLFFYQRAEAKEDGQLFFCRMLIVDYIHQRDSGE